MSHGQPAAVRRKTSLVMIGFGFRIGSVQSREVDRAFLLTLRIHEHSAKAGVVERKALHVRAIESIT